MRKDCSQLYFMQNFKLYSLEFKNYVNLFKSNIYLIFCCNIKETKFFIYICNMLLHINLIFFKILDKLVIKV